MHLLAAQPGAVSDGSEAVDLGQSPGDIVVLSAADSELACLAGALDGFDDSFPTVRLANLLHLGHPMSVDLYVEAIVAEARLVVVRLLGGVRYWSYGIEQVTAVCRQRGIQLAVLPGDDQPDPELAGLCVLPQRVCHRLWQYCVHGGSANATQFLRYAADLIGRTAPAWREPSPILRAGLYWPGMAAPVLEDISGRWPASGPVAAIIFYRALVQGGDLLAIDAVIEAVSAQGLNPLPIFVSSLKDPVSADLIRQLFAETKPDVILNTTAFAVSVPGQAMRETPFGSSGAPVIQLILAGNNEAAWRASPTGLTARDIAMNVALPEVDGRLGSRAISFKGESRYAARAECSVVGHQPVTNRVGFVAQMAARWVRLRRAPVAKRRVALILANYPNRDGRLGNGVGLDTPESLARLLTAMADAGYGIADQPRTGQAVIDRVLAGPTNDLTARENKSGGIDYPLSRYQAFFATLPADLRTQVTERWGKPEDDPFCVDTVFRLALFRVGQVVVGLQPARGYNIDPSASYHDPDLVPPHGYIAFYAWLRQDYDADAIVHMGKHGNLEWLPGKSVALTAACYPEAILGPVPHIYPFIVNDPGEGTQAKRRAQAVIIDHLTPPLTRAETYGPLARLEMLVDEFYQAAGVDPRRMAVLRDDILTLSADIGLNADCGIAAADDAGTALGKLDNYLCELKELQIRDGLHIFGTPPAGRQLTDLLVALLRVPRAGSTAGDASLIRALAADLGLSGPSFDPLDCVPATPWAGPRPSMLAAISAETWRSQGDTLERLELLAAMLVDEAAAPADDWTATRAVLEELDTRVRPAVLGSGTAELAGILTAFDGGFVDPGASGAPTRGRLDVLPTGRNFYSVDSRTVPTAAAWLLGWKSAGLLIDRYRQDNGAWPRRMALSAWGTSNMRTGGDDIAQALALIGVRPVWDTASGRVTSFEILPADILDRPRVDVVLRISGFFRDAFPAQIDLFDSAVQAVAALDEPESVNPLAASVRDQAARLAAEGVDPAAAKSRAGHRIFGSKPGAYGAGLQALIDERGWQTEADLARAYIAWGGYAYGAGSAGQPEHRLFERQLASVEAVVHNQDNREHDLLDSDDYYQFEGGMTAAVHLARGRRPDIYHNDHSRPERPRVLALEEEIARTVRARVVNPKWIAGVMRHGYKGAFEMAATVDYLFAFAATTGAVRDHHFDLVYDAYLDDPDVRAFLSENNPAALQEIAERLLEAQSRGLWRPRSNKAYDHLVELMSGSGTA